MAPADPGATLAHSYPRLVQKSTPVHPGCNQVALEIGEVVLNESAVVGVPRPSDGPAKTHGRIVDQFTPAPALMDYHHCCGNKL